MLRSAARNKVTGYRIAGALRRAAVPMRSLSLLSVLLSVTLLSVSILSATLLSGCAKPVREPKIVTVLDPTEINHLSLGGMVVTAHRDQAISPDSKHSLWGCWATHLTEWWQYPSTCQVTRITAQSPLLGRHGLDPQQPSYANAGWMALKHRMPLHRPRLAGPRPK